MAFLQHVLDLLNPIGGVSARALFGGHGLYRHGTVFGMVVADALYLKADDANREAFVSRGLLPFRCCLGKDRRKVAMSYFQAPAEALDDADAMVRWALCSYEAALRGKTAHARANHAPDARGQRRQSAPRVGLGRATTELIATTLMSAAAQLPALAGLGGGGASPSAPSSSGAVRASVRGRSRR